MAHCSVEFLLILHMHCPWYCGFFVINCLQKQVMSAVLTTLTEHFTSRAFRASVIFLLQIKRTALLCNISNICKRRVTYTLIEVVIIIIIPMSRKSCLGEIM